jgi:hypothetical protein
MTTTAPSQGGAAGLPIMSLKEYRSVTSAGQCFSPGTPFSSTNKTDRHDITEILLKVAINIITPYPIYRSE